MHSRSLPFLFAVAACNRVPSPAPPEPLVTEASQSALAAVSVLPPQQPPSWSIAGPIDRAEPAATVAPEPAPARALRVRSGSCAAAGCPIVLTFDQPMVEGAELGGLPVPEVTLEPPQAGSWAWTQASILTFTPAPGAMGWGNEVGLTLAEAVPLAGEESALRSPFVRRISVPYFRAGGKVATWPVVQGEPRFVGFLNRFTLRVGAGPMLLLFDQPVEPSTLALKVQDRLSRSLRVRTHRPRSVAHALDEELDLRHVVAITISDLPSDGEPVVVQIPSVEAPEVYALEVRRQLVLDEIGFVGQDAVGDPVDLDAELVLDFDNPVELAALQKALRLEPAAPLHVGGTWAEARVHFELAPGTDYRLTAAAGLRDVLGNAPTNRLSLSFRSRDLPPALAVPSLPLSAELDRPLLEVRGTNIDDLEVRAWTFPDAATFARALGNGAGERCADHGTTGPGAPVLSGPLAAKPNSGSTLHVPLPPSAGLRCVEVAATGTGSEATGRLTRASLVQTSDLGLTAKVFEDHVMAWVTRLGQPEALGGAAVSVLDASGRELARGVTERTGVVLLDAHPAGTSGVDETLFLVARDGDDQVVLRLQEDRLSRPWQFGLDGAVPDARPLDAVLFTERGAYRPGDTVHAAVMAGPDLAAAAATLTVTDARGQQVQSSALELDRYGTGSMEVPLQKGAAVGRYTLRADIAETHTVRHFRVEEYRIPTFEVSVSADGPWTRGAPIDAVLGAAYLHGGTLDARPVHWEVHRVPETFSPSGFPGFAFHVGDRAALVGTVAGGEARLDGNGRLAVSFEAAHPSSAGPMRYTLQAHVTDIDRQNYAGHLSRVVHPAAFYVGVKAPSRAIVAAGQRLQVPIVAVAPDGTALPGVRVRARLERVDHHTTARVASDGSVQTLSRPVAGDGRTCTVTTGETAATCTFTVDRAGAYRVRAWARDVDHQDVQAGFELTATGAETVAWPRFERERIEITADRPAYAPGDVARLVVQTPWPTASGLLTVERDGVLAHRLFTITENTPAIDLPITDAMAPNVYASVVLVRGRVHTLKDATGFETGAPAFRLGIAELNVAPDAQRLRLQVTPDRLRTNPGAPLTVALDMRDASGAPAEGQATVMVVDEAILGLTGYRTPDPVAQLYPDKPLGVRTADSRIELAHARRERREVLFPGGDGSDSDAAAFANHRLRDLFESTALFDAAVPIGPDGQGSVTFDLPDNTTTWRVMAVAIDGRRRGGAGQAQVVVRRPLMVQPVLPRFAYPGDTLPVQAIVHNGTDHAGTASVTVTLAGLEASDGLEESARVPAEGTATVAFPVTVTGRAAATLRFVARLEDHEDVVEVPLPILEPGSHRTQVLSQTVADSTTLALTLPPDRVRGTEKLEVVASTTALTELKDAVGYLMGYPNGCIEQTTSRAYPLVVLEDLLPEIGVEVDPAALRDYSEAGVRRILAFQTEGGGLSYWPGGTEPHAFATAFGLTALIEAKKRGYNVPDAALTRMGDYLEQTLSQGDVTESIPHGNIADGDTRALFVVTLGRLHRPQPGWISHLWEERARLTPFGLSLLGIAAAEHDSDHPLLQQILAEVEAAAEQAGHEAWFEGDRRGGYSMDSPLRTHAGALLAFARGGRDQKLGGKLLTGLLGRRQGGLWGNTQENVFGIMGVHALSSRGVGEGPAPALKLTHNGQAIDPATLQVVSKRVRRLQVGADALGDHRHEVALHNTGTTPVILTVRAEYDLALTEQNRAPAAAGARVTRVVEDLDGNALTGPIPLGSLVRVRIGLHTDEPLNYVAVDDKLPAGLEPLNTRLETTQRVSAGPLLPAVERGLGLLSYQEIRDHRVAFYADELPAGEVAFEYVARATTPGTFLRPAASAEAMYDPSVYGRTSIDTVVVQ